MSDQTLRSFVSCFAVAYILGKVCLVDSRPPSVGLAREAITEWLHMKDVRASNGYFNASNKASATAPRILNHPRRSSNERFNGGSLSNHSRLANSGSQPRKEDGIIFPSDLGVVDDRLLQKLSFEPDEKMFQECSNDGSSYCENIDNYPGLRVKELLQNEVDKFQSFFGKDKVIEPSLVHRIDDPSEVPLCVSRETTVFPKVAKNEQNNLLYIVNEGEYMQGVRVEKCHSMGQCAFGDNFPNGYRAMCKQKHIYRRLLALNGAGKPHPDSFLFPSCCVCTVKTVGTLTTRMGLGPKPDMSPLQRNNAPNTKTADPAIPETAEKDHQKEGPAKHNSTMPKATPTPPKSSGKIVFNDNLKPLPLRENLDEKRSH